MKNNFPSKSLKALEIFVLFIVASTSFAQTVYYADNVNGNDANSGLVGSPKKTFTSVFATAPAGSIIDLTGTFTWGDVGETTSVTSGFTINKSMTIRGQGADQTIVQANALPDVANRRVFTINSGVTVVLEKLAIKNGKVANLDNSVYPADGGGVYNSGILTLNYCRITQNYAIAGSSYSGGAGGGISHVANNTMTINGCTFDNNQANTGGALVNEFANASGRFIITNSTFAYNKQLALVATVGGGAIWILNGTNIITNSTFAYNDLNNSNGSGTGDGASILVRQGNVKLKNNIFVNGTRSGQPLSGGRIEIAFSGGSATDEGNNIFGVQSSITFSATSWQPSSGGGYQNVGDTTKKCLLNVDSVLQTNGATNGIVSLKTTGLNIEEGSTIANNGVSIPSIDQRGLTRVGTPDIGAYEYTDLAPFVSCFSPSTGAEGTSIAIKGVNFTGASSVKFNSVEAASFTFNSDVSITAIAPQSTTGLISVTTNQGTGNSSSNYTYLPSIIKTGTLTAFSKCAGSPSAAQTFTVSGSNLTANLLVAAYANLEYSLDDTTYSASISLTPTSGSVATTTIYVRMTTASASLTSGNISITSTNAATQTMAVSGTVNATIPTPTISAPTVQSFTSLGATTWTAPAGVTSVDYLIVGGGGGGANGYDNAGGGGGGGGMVLTGRLAVTPGTTYPIVIGDGGNGGANTRANNWGLDGQNSSFDLITAFGGDQGRGSRTVALAGVAQNGNCVFATGGGGSGGGFGGKGGGGAVGNGNINSASTGGAGGAGKSSSITGVTVTYGAGGAGGSNATSATGANGSTNRGNGGNAGTAGSSSSAAGGKGGSGIVVLKYATQSTGISYCQDETALPLAATASSGNILQWYTVASGGTASLTAPTPDTSVAGTTTYYVSQKDNTSGCESARIAINVTVNALPSAPTAAAATINYCKGETASPIVATFSPGNYLQWYEGTTLLTTCEPIPSTTTVGTTTYNVRQITASGCVSSQTTVTVNVYDLPTITGSTSLHVGQTITLIGSGTPNASTPWASSNTSIATVSSSGVVTGVIAGTATITYMNSNGCTVSSSITVTPAPTVTASNLTAGATNVTYTFTYTLGQAASSNVFYLFPMPTGFFIPNPSSFPLTHVTMSVNGTNIPTSTWGNVGNNWTAGVQISSATPAGSSIIVVVSGVTNSSTAGSKTFNWKNANGSGAAIESFSASLTLTPSNQWTGATNNNWTTASNWSLNTVPNEQSIISIPSTSNMPEISTSVVVSGLTVSSSLVIRPSGVLRVNGNFTNNGQIIFKSDATGSGAFDAFSGTVTGTGTVIVERYIPSKRAFRFLSPSVTTTTSIKQNWQNNGTNTAGLGTHITGTGGTTNGFDVTATNNPSLFTFDNGSWLAVTNTNVNVLTAGTPYRLMVRGDRTTDLTSNTSSATATTLRATGTLKTGNFTPNLNQSADGFSLIGNPYQAPIDIKAILTASTNMSSNVVYYWDPTLNARGGYVTRNLSTDVNDVTSSFNQYVQPGQAVFVKKDNTANVPTMTITEANKSVANAAAGVFRNTNTSTDFGLLRVNLQANNQTIEGALALFDAEYTWNVTSEDATKMANLDEEVSFVQNNTNLAIALQSNPSATSELPIKIDKMRHTNYQWQFELNNYSGATPYLFDTLNNSYTQINNGTVVPFTADLNTTNRFKIVFQNSMLSIDDFANNIKLYPNPSKAGASFYLQGISEATITVNNLLGQTVPVQTKSQGTTLQVTPNTNLSQGVYLVNITTQGITQQVKWIVE